MACAGRASLGPGEAQERLCVSSGLEFEPLLVGQDSAVDGVRDASFRAAAGFLDGFVFGDLASVVVASGAGVARLSDGGDVDRCVELAVASPRQSVGLLVAAGHVDGGRAGVAGVVLLVGKAPDVAGPREDLRGGQEPDALDLGQGGPGSR